MTLIKKLRMIMSISEKININNLLINDEFIAWINSGNIENNQYWDNIKKNLSAKEKVEFEKAEKIIRKIKMLNIDNTEDDVSPQFIQDQYIHLLEKSFLNKKPQVKIYKINKFLKYAAAIIFFVGLLSIFLLLNNNNTFKKHLSLTKFNTKDILLQTSNNEFYKLTETTNNKWLTNNGEFISIDSNNISFIASDDIQEKEIQYKLFIPKGKKYNLTLVDGTKIELNSNSTITFNNSTISNLRSVHLTGEAFFNVVRNENRPFVVQSSDMKVEVFGTAFNVSNYEEIGYTSTTLINGTIKVSNPHGEEIIIKPGEQAKLFHNHNKIEVKNVDVQKVVAWTSGRMIFTAQKLVNLIPRMNRWFDVEFLIEDEYLKEYRFTGTLKKENSLIHYLQILKYTKGINYKIEGKQVRLFIIDK